MNDSVLDPKRQKWESFKDYKERMAVVTIGLRIYKLGTIFHDSRPDPKKKGITFRKKQVNNDTKKLRRL